MGGDADSGSDREMEEYDPDSKPKPHDNTEFEEYDPDSKPKPKSSSSSSNSYEDDAPASKPKKAPADDDEDDGKKKKKKKKKKGGRKVPFLESFKQQKLYSWEIVMPPLVMILAFILLGALFAILGSWLVITATYSKESRVYRYDNVCETDSKCVIRFELEEDFPEPVFLYYRLENYYQNHRRYYRSRSEAQLNGEHPNDYDKLGGCTPKISQDDDESPDKIFLPCGLSAWSYFNDTFQLKADNGKIINQQETDIAWPSDFDALYKDPGADTAGIRIVDSFENEHFAVWMRNGALPSFIKTYAKINRKLDAGVYRIEIENNYPVYQFDGRKYFKLVHPTWIGGRNFYMGIVYLALSAVLLTISIGFLVKQICFHRKMGDIGYIAWLR